MDCRKGNIESLHFNICAVVPHFDRNQTTAAIPLRSVVEGERERKGMKRKQGQLKES